MQEGDTDSLGINDVARVLDRALGAPEGHLVAECSGWHVIELEHRAAADLDDEEEKRALAKAIFEQARQAAQDACSQNAECPNGKLIRLEMDKKPVQVDGEWRIEFRVIFECTQ